MTNVKMKFDATIIAVGFAVIFALGNTSCNQAPQRPKVRFISNDRYLIDTI